MCWDYFLDVRQKIPVGVVEERVPFAEAQALNFSDASPVTANAAPVARHVWWPALVAHQYKLAWGLLACTYVRLSVSLLHSHVELRTLIASPPATLR